METDVNLLIDAAVASEDAPNVIMMDDRKVNPRTNVVYLTAYVEYSFDAWKTGASGFTLKPLTKEGVQAQLRTLRYLFSFGGVRE